MRFIGNYSASVMPVPGDIAQFPEGALMRFDLDGGWQVLDTFRGQYEDGAEYGAGDVVVRGGALWISCPHEGEGAWCCIAGNRRGEDS